MRVFKNAAFERFAHKQDISDTTLWEVIERVEKGLIDADLGGDVIKQRVPRRGQGRRGGFRTVILYRKNERAFFVYGFAKNEQDNISNEQREDLKELAAHIFALTNMQIEKLLASGQFKEVYRDEQGI